MIKAALSRGAQIDDVIVDPGYSLAKAETFRLPVRREGPKVTFRPASYQWNPKPFNDDAITIGGQLFYAGVPEKMQKLTMPPMGSTVEQKQKYEEAYNERASYRYRLHAGPDSDGTTRWQNPFAARSLRSEQLPESMRNARRGPLVELVDGNRPAGTVSVSAADLPLQQECIAGTTAHSISMNRRNAVEGVNGNLKSNFTNVDRGYARVFGTEKVAFFLAFTLAGLNLLLARSHRRMVAAEKEVASAPKRRKKRRTGTFDKVLGPATDPSQRSMRRRPSTIWGPRARGGPLGRGRRHGRPRASLIAPASTSLMRISTRGLHRRVLHQLKPAVVSS